MTYSVVLLLLQVALLVALPPLSKPKIVVKIV